ncbi:MAG: DUF3891 family protein [Opitutaceae bacterium]|jgi:hypothetical protein
MIRAATETGWMLVHHRDHAVLAGDFASAWGNGTFPKPEPFADIQFAVAHHDDGWIARDALPSLTKDNKPEAFTRSLVGAYSAFEEIDLPNYLRVRGEATAAVAKHNAYAGILVSMHTVNLLTEQADVATIRPEHRPSYDAFVEAQRSWQRETAKLIGASADHLQRGFEFLQCCDNLSLIACSGYESERELRHRHPDRHGVRHAFKVAPMGDNVWHLSPWPFAESRLEFTFPYRLVSNAACSDLAAFRHACAEAKVHQQRVTLVS